MRWADWICEYPVDAERLDDFRALVDWLRFTYGAVESAELPTKTGRTISVRAQPDVQRALIEKADAAGLPIPDYLRQEFFP